MTVRIKGLPIVLSVNSRAQRDAMEDGATRGALAARVGWPRDSGESARGWKSVGASVVNRVRYAEFVHGGSALDDAEANIERSAEETAQGVGLEIVSGL